MAIPFLPEERPLTRVNRSPNHYPFHQISVSNNVCKYSFFPQTIVTWNNLPMNTSVNSLDKFEGVALPVIKSLLKLIGTNLFTSIFLFHISIILFIYTSYI